MSRLSSSLRWVVRAGCLTGAILALSCSNSTEPEPPPPPGPTVDLTGYFVLPASGFVKLFSDGTSRNWVQDTIVNGVLCSDAINQAGDHEYLATSNRNWVGTLLMSGTLIQLAPPLAAIPNLMPATGTHVANSAFVALPNNVPVRRISQLIDTGLSVTVPAGTFDSVVLIRQEFLVFDSTLGVPDTKTDSAYRWYAPGVDEVRRIQWRHGTTDSTLMEFQAGQVNGNTYP